MSCMWLLLSLAFAKAELERLLATMMTQATLKLCVYLVKMITNQDIGEVRSQAMQKPPDAGTIKILITVTVANHTYASQAFRGRSVACSDTRTFPLSSRTSLHFKSIVPGTSTYNMGLYKTSAKLSSKPSNTARVDKENRIPSVDQDALKAAALISVIETYIRDKPRLTVPECMKLAGIPENVASNKTIQQRVRRLVKKLSIRIVLAAIDDSLLAHHGICPNVVETQEQAFCESALKAAALIHLIDSSAREQTLLSAYDCMLHAGLSPIAAEYPTSQPLLLRLVSLLSLDDVLVRVDSILQGSKSQTVTSPLAAVAAASVIR